jgi:endonuclease YncB( thermonuclease family)
VSKHWKPGKKTVELQAEVRPSRIRRQPPPVEKKKPQALTPELELWGGASGITLFAVAIAVLILAISAATVGLFAGDQTAQHERFGSCYDGAGPNCVIDGGAIRLAGERVDIAGLQAPEIEAPRCPEEQRLGAKTVERLIQLLNSGKVTAGPAFRDQFGRDVRRVQVEGEDVAGTLISAGLARKARSGRANWCG